MSLKKYITEAAQAKSQPVTGSTVNFTINGIKNIKSPVVEHNDGKFVLELDEAQLDELLPLIGAAGGALARGAAAGGSALARGAAKVAVGTGLKSAADKLDKKLFGPANDYDYDTANEDFEDEDEIEYQPTEGDIVRIDYPSVHQGQLGQVVELAPSGDFAYVQFKDGDIGSYHVSDLAQVDENEADSFLNQPEDDFDESLNDVRRLAGMKKESAPAFNGAGSIRSSLDKLSTVQETENYDMTPGGPYDRGAADGYYGRPARPHKWVNKEGGVPGEREMVPLTDPKEIAAYMAGYGKDDGQKDYGSFPDYDVDESVIEAVEVYIKEAKSGNLTKISLPCEMQMNEGSWNCNLWSK